jgi:hypothetical protein
LIRITNDADVGLISGQKSDKPVLAGIDILVFIDKKIAETVYIPILYIRIFFKQLNRPKIKSSKSARC